MKLTAEEGIAALRALYQHPAYHAQWVLDRIKYIEVTGIVHDWLEELCDKRHTWHVHHEGEVYTTDAISEQDAVNKVRFRLYGRTPQAELSPFDTVNPCAIIMAAIGDHRRRVDAATPRDLWGRKLTKDDAIARLRRMAS